jgi:hypothetical protein
MRKTVQKFGWGDLISAARGMIEKPYDVFSKHAATAIEHQWRVTDATIGIIRTALTDEQPSENSFLKLLAKLPGWAPSPQKVFLVSNQPFKLRFKKND